MDGKKVVGDLSNELYFQRYIDTFIKRMFVLGGPSTPDHLMNAGQFIQTNLANGKEVIYYYHFPFGMSCFYNVLKKLTISLNMVNTLNSNLTSQRVLLLKLIYHYMYV